MSNLPRIFKLGAAVAAGVVCMSISDNVSSLRQANLVTTADARVGHPLTPMSVAGVARRTTRRAVVRHGAYYGAADYGTRASGYRRGYGLGVAAVAGAAVGSGYDASGAYDAYASGDASAAYASAGYGTGDAYILHGTYISESDAVAYCAQQFRSYHVESRTFVAYSGQRVSCPQ